MAEQPMLDFVPFTGPWRIRADLNPHPGGSGEALQLLLPQPIALTIPPPPVGGAQYPRRGEVALTAQLVPPLRNGGDGKLGRILRDAD
jgi:hypothetical protein